MTVDVASLVSDNLDIWTMAVERKSGAGRGGGKRVSLYGIDRLRNLILDLAMRGKLVSQDAEDEPASEVLKKIGAEREKLIKAGVIGKRKAADRNSDDAPYLVPEGWAWTKIADIGHDWGQMEPPGDFTYVDVGSIDQRAGIIRSPSVLSAGEAPSRARKIVKVGTVIYSTVRPYLLNIAVIDQEFDPEPIASTAFAIVHPFEGVEAGFLFRYLRSPTFIAYVEACQTGIAYPAINDKQFFSAWFPLPPFAEQQRIVAKVDELMALCDALEEESAAAMAAHQVLVETLLATLTDGTDPADLAANWARLEAHFDTLFTTEASVDALKQSVRHLAVRGKLVRQDKRDEPASELLDRIKAWQAEAVAKKEIRLPRKPLKPIGADEKPYPCPMNWEWVRLGEIIYIQSGDGLTASQMIDGAVPVYGGNGVNGYHNAHNVSEKTVVIGRVGFYCGSVHVTPETAWVTDNAFITHFSDANIDLEFLQLLLSSTNLKEEENATAQPVISGSKIYPIVVGLPPLAEQKRIVAKVDELMALCDALKHCVTDASATQRHLADAIVERVAA